MPRVGLPPGRARSLAAPAATGFVIFALAGLYFALIPGILARDLHQQNVALGGAIVFELGLTATVCVVLARRLEHATAMRGGLILVLPAVAIVVISRALPSLALLSSATALAGAALALGYRGSLELVNEITPADRRAEVVSSYFVACFVGNSVPVIGVGVLATLAQPLVATATFACTVAAFSVAALAWNRREGRASQGHLPKP